MNQLQTVLSYLPDSSVFPGNYFGFRNGKLFGEVSPHVSIEKAPGMSTLPKPTVYTWLTGAPFLLLYSPNTVWCITAFGLYFMFPYDLSPTGAAYQSPFSWNFFMERFPLWFAMTFGYTSFWHGTLYFLNWAKRPFIPNRPYNLDKVAHNITWSLSGVIIWTLFENLFSFLWATNRLPYLTNADSFTTVDGLIRFSLVTMLIPVWRDIHFYFAHRFLHYRELYMQVHSLHHRNTDVEPFSGLCMHPIEHLYYFSCILPSLVFLCSPFAFVWNGAHLLLSPGASHSGYEDHFQADAFHYMHHRYFECNYAGFGASFLDILMGTFVESMEVKEKKEITLRDDAKSSLRILPTKEFITYLGTSISCMVPWAYCATQIASGKILLPEALSILFALLAGFGPVGTAWIVTSIFGGAAGTPINNYKAVLHILTGSLLCSVPISYMCYLSLVEASV